MALPILPDDNWDKEEMPKTVMEEKSQLMRSRTIHTVDNFDMEFGRRVQGEETISDPGPSISKPYLREPSTGHRCGQS